MVLREHTEATSLLRKHSTNNPFQILAEMDVRIIFSEKYQKLKGFCFICNRIPFVVINDHLPDEEKRIVAAHELGHICLHRDLLQCAFMSDDAMFARKDKTELEANIFAADLLISDNEILAMANEDGADCFSMAKTLSVMPELLTFKIHSMKKRGFELPLPFSIKSNFLY